MICPITWQWSAVITSRTPQPSFPPLKNKLTGNFISKANFFWADAINILLKRGLRMRIEKVETWLDSGTPESLLETNCYLLDHGHDNSDKLTPTENTVIIPPVFIHPTAQVTQSVVGPYVSIGENVTIKDCLIRESIVGPGSWLKSCRLEDSLIGHECVAARPDRPSQPRRQ